VQTLGEGGFGRVLLVRNRKRNVQFAMKELQEEGPDIYREVELLVTLTRTHPVSGASRLDLVSFTISLLPARCLVL
jgi:serine/threonine protein kinase